MSTVLPPSDALPVEVNGQIIDPRVSYATDAKNTDYIVVTMREILNIEQEKELYDLDVTIIEDLGNDSFLCRYPPSDLSPIRKKEFVRQVDVYRNKYKIPMTLGLSAPDNPFASTAAASEASPDEDSLYLTVDILTHETVTEGEFEDLKRVIANKSGISLDDMQFAQQQVRLTVEAKKLFEIVQDDRIRIIEEVVQPSLMSAEFTDVRDIVRGNSDGSELPYTGKGQIITVTDTGFDTGSVDDCHPAFRGKISSLIPIARSSQLTLSQQKKTDDPQGHGTHVSGVLVGHDFSTTGGRVGGIAPGCKLIVQSLYHSPTKEFQEPADRTEYLAVPYGQGSRIFSNSWGRGYRMNPKVKGQEQPEYETPARIVDNFVRDHPDTLVCFAAGNDNETAPGQPTVGLYAGAKNVLTVGATGNQLAPDTIYGKSSMGPTKEGRLKPDVVAPGVEILAALSGARKKNPEGTVATAADTPARWWYMSGTSQATPLVAGCAALLREAFDEKGFPNPPGALLKALLINGADFLPGIPRNAQGHGRVNVLASLEMVKIALPIRGKDEIGSPSVIGGTLIGTPLKQDDEFEFSLAPLSGQGTDTQHTHFRITMVYNDIGNRAIQNNLNLFVVDGGTNSKIPGNDRSLTDLDTQNVVEQIILDYVPRNGLKVTVHAQKILALQEQDFVVAWSVFTPLAARPSS